MPRGLTTNQLNALASNYIRLALLCELNFTNGTAYVWSGLGSLVYNGITYQGIGQLGKVSSVPANNSVMAQGITLTLEAIDPSLLSDVLNNIQTQNTASLSLVLLNEQQQVIDGIINCYTGYFDHAVIDENANGPMVTINIENKLAQLNRPVGWTWSQADIDYLYQGDTSYQYCGLLQDFQYRWGS